MNRLPMMNSLQGHLLIASPQMDDPRFARTVLLMLKHNREGALGIILNRPMDNEEEALDFIDALPSEEQRIQMGGPVAGPLIVLRGKHESHDGTQGGVFVIEKIEQLERLLEQDEAPLQFYVGHAGWTGGQLEEELADGVWMSTPAHPDFVFGEHDDMWVNAIRESGRSFYRNVLGISGFPKDAGLN